jgi:hypothetical protein
MEKELKDAYYNINGSNIAYTSTSRLIDTFKNKYSADKIKKWVKEQEVINLHKPVRRKYARNFALCHFPFQWIHSDLAQVDNISKHNDGISYLLCAIDCFSKMAYVEPLKTKTSKEVSAKLELIFQKIGHKIVYFCTDCGREYLGECNKIYKKYDIKHIKLANSDSKAFFAEIFIRYLKKSMYIYFQHHNTYKFTDVLQQLVDNYNTRKHSATKFAPVDLVSSLENQKKAFIHMFAKKLKLPYEKPVYSVGDLVRISVDKGNFSKSYYQGYSTELFRVKDVLVRRKPLYVLESYYKKPLIGVFHRQELVPGQIKDLYNIEKIIRTRGTGKNKQALVRWEGYSAESDTWVPFSDIKSLVK